MSVPLFPANMAQGRCTSEPFNGASPVNLATDTVFATPPRGVYVGTGGVIKVDCLAMDLTTILSSQLITVQDGAVLPLANILKIYSTANGTTALGLWVGA